MKPASSGLAQYNNNLRHVLLNSTSNSATQAVRTDMFRASLVDNPLWSSPCEVFRLEVWVLSLRRTENAEEKTQAGRDCFQAASG